MKTIAVVLMTLVGISSNARAQCANEAEAQIIAKVVAVDAASCKIKVGSIKFYADNQLCPLFLDEVVTSEIGNACAAKVGEDVSGILIRNGNQISFE